MNGSRSAHPRHGDQDRSSLDALSRTIEGLEARIQGLMAGGRTAAPPTPPLAPPQRAVEDNRQPRMPATDLRPKACPAGSAYGERLRDPLAEIRERQRMLEQTSQSSRQYDVGAARPAVPAQPEQRAADPRFDQRTGTRR